MSAHVDPYDYARRSEAEQAELNAYLTGLGLTVTDCVALDVDDAGRVTIECYQRDADGTLMRTLDQTPAICLVHGTGKLPAWITATEEERARETCLAHFQTEPCETYAALIAGGQ